MRSRDLILAAITILGLGHGRRAEGAAATILLRWDAVPSATSYEIEIASDAAFEHIVLDESVNVPTFEWRELPLHEYYWRLRCHFPFERTGRWSDGHRILTAVEPPRPTEPSDGAVLVSGTGAVCVSLGYRASNTIADEKIEVSTDPNFTQIVAVVDGASGSATVTLPETGTYFWRVQSSDILGRVLPPSVARMVSIAPPPPSPSREPRRSNAIAAAPVPRSIADAPAADPIAAVESIEAAAQSKHSFATGVGLGWQTSTGRAVSPFAAIDATISLRSHPEGGVRVRVGYFERSTRLPAASPWATQSSRSRIVPISVQLAGRHPLADGIEVYGGAGPVLNLLDVRLGPEERLIALPGACAVGGASIAMRRGTGFVEVGASLGRLSSGDVRLDAGGMLVLAGIRFGGRP